MRGRRAALAANLAALALAGCDRGGGTTGATAPAPPGTGYFVGSSGDVGASVDFGGFDQVSLALLEALAPDARPPDRIDLAVGIASIVNSSAHTVPEPVFVGLRADGGTVGLRSARRALAGRDDEAARRARALMPPPGAVAPNGTRTVYMLLEGVRAGDLAGVRMRVGTRDPVDLRREQR